MLPSKTFRKLDAGLVEVRRLGLSEYMARLHAQPEIREMETFKSFITESEVAERHQLTKRLTSLMTPLDVQGPPGSPSPVKKNVAGKFAELDLHTNVSFSQFRTCVDSFSKSGIKCSTSQRLTLYGLYKQSMFGDIDYVRPADDTKGQRKYDAWNVFNGLSQAESMSAYVGIVTKLLNGDVAQHDGDHASKPEVFGQSNVASSGVYKMRPEVAAFESEDVKELFDEVLRRYYDWESFGAAEVLKKLKSVLPMNIDATKKAVVQKLMQETENAKLLKVIEEKGVMAENALSDFAEQEDESRWIFSQESFGTRVWYRMEESDGSLWIKVEGELDGCPCADVLSVWKEIDLFPTWFPTCHNADILWESTELKGAELVAGMKIGMMPLVRDAVIVGYGDISTKSIMILGKSITEWPGVEIPEPQGWTTKRMTFRALQIMVEPTSATSTKCSLISNMDLNAVVPQQLLNVIMRKVAGLILIFLKKECMRIQEDPDNSLHAQRIKTSPFYTEQLAGKMDRFLAALPQDAGKVCLLSSSLKIYCLACPLLTSLYQNSILTPPPHPSCGRQSKPTT